MSGERGWGYTLSARGKKVEKKGKGGAETVGKALSSDLLGGGGCAGVLGMLHVGRCSKNGGGFLNVILTKDNSYKRGRGKATGKTTRED